MQPRGNPRTVCDEIAGELRDISNWLSTGELDPEQFRQAVLALEDRKVSRFGLKLSGCNRNGVTEFQLHFLDDGTLCATVRANSQTGELSTEFSGEC